MNPIALPPLYAIVNVDTLSNPLEFVKNLLSAGIEILQLRAKETAAMEFLSLACQVVTLREKLSPKCLIIINDSVSICEQSGANGVHLGQEDIDPRLARKILGDHRFIGLSTHTLEQVEEAPANILDYLGFGPIFPSPTKFGHAAVLGVAAIRDAVKKSALPLVAIGGITIENVDNVYRSGARCVAVASDLKITGAPDQLQGDWQNKLKERIQIYYLLKGTEKNVV